MPRLLTKPWIDAYEELLAPSVSPRNYITWAALGLVGAALKRNVYTWNTGIQYFPNQYIVLVGPPGIGKGTAIRPGVAIAEKNKTVNFLTDRITAEFICETLSKGVVKPVAVTGSKAVTFTPDHTALIYAAEFSLFLSSSDWMCSLLCELWDEHTIKHQTKKHGSIVVTDMCTSLIGCCTTEYIQDLGRDKLSAITGGFTARTLFIYAQENFNVPADDWDAPSKNVTQLQDNLVNDLDYISETLTGKFTVADHAKGLWKSKETEYSTIDSMDPLPLKNFKSRIKAHVIKAAMVLSASESDLLVIEERHLQRAITLVESVRETIEVTFGAVGLSDDAVVMDKILTFLRKKGVTSRSELMRLFRRDVGSVEHLDRIINGLEVAQLVTTEWKNSSQKITYRGP